MRLFLCIEILLFFISIMQTCRKTHRESAVAELIGNLGGKLEGKGTKETGGDSRLCVGKYTAGGSGWINVWMV